MSESHGSTGQGRRWPNAAAAPLPRDAPDARGCETLPGGCQGLEREEARSRVPALAVAMGIALAIMVAELVGYFMTGGSLVLLSDAGHMLSDVGSIGLSLFAAWIARRPASAARTYGYYRAEILAALVNGGVLIGVTIWLVVEAYRRVTRPEHAPPLDARLMIGFGSFTFVANAICAAILRRAQPHHDDHDDAGAHHHHDLNLRGALLHVVGDVLASAGTVIAGVVILETGWLAADAVAAALLGVLILASAIGLVLRSVDVLLESAPSHVDVAALEAALGRVAGILSVHDLHVWTITSGLHAMSCHVRIARGIDPHRILIDLNAVIRERFGIEHTTIQVETDEPAAASAK